MLALPHIEVIEADMKPLIDNKAGNIKGHQNLCSEQKAGMMTIQDLVAMGSGMKQHNSNLYVPKSTTENVLHLCRKFALVWL